MENSLRDNLDKILREKGWSRYRLSKESGVPASVIYNIFNKDSNVSLKPLRKLADAVGSAKALIGR
jgi:predicted transcriptional regulator